MARTRSYKREATKAFGNKTSSWTRTWKPLKKPTAEALARIEILKKELESVKKSSSDQKIYKKQLILDQKEELIKAKQDLETAKADFHENDEKANRYEVETTKVNEEIDGLLGNVYRQRELKLQKKMANDYKKMSEEMKDQVADQPYSWEKCELCHKKYTIEEERSPRILACGHTLCLSCAWEIREANRLCCPFDQIIMNFNGHPIEKKLPRNYTVQDICGISDK